MILEDHSVRFIWKDR